MSLGDVMIMAGGFWDWCLFAHCKVCERSRSGQSHNKNSSKLSTVLTTFKLNAKQRDGIFFTARMFWRFWQQDLGNRSVNQSINQTLLGGWHLTVKKLMNLWPSINITTIVISINFWTLCWTTQCSQRRCTRRAGTAFWMCTFTICSFSFLTDKILFVIFSV